MRPPPLLRRRAVLAAAAVAPLVGCGRDDRAPWTGSWLGADVGRGHRLRERKAGSIETPAVRRRADVIVVGAGIAGLGAARALMRAGIDEVHVFDLEASAGGNSRGHTLGGTGCPLGAHYVPVPGRAASEVAELLSELGLRREVRGRVQYDERHLCHSPQERLYIEGTWHDGLLPPIDAMPAAEGERTLAAYRRFAAIVDDAMATQAFAIPAARGRQTPAVDALDALTFAEWLDREALVAPALRWYLDYCCRDDFGAGVQQVSAWAGLHYFASRHGFQAPGEGGGEERDGVLTWPEGNAWLSRRLAAPLGTRLHLGCVALRIAEGRHEVEVDLRDEVGQRIERWTAPKVVVAVPLFIAARLLTSTPAALVEAVGRMRHAPWLVANLQLGAALADRGGAAPAWDNVLYGGPTLGYVDARHQSLLPHPGPTVLTVYWALGGASEAEGAAARARLLNEPWSSWAQAVVGAIAPAHPDLPAKVQRIDLMRYGHAMSIPLPGLHGSAALAALADRPGRVQFAHSDLSGYSTFEEALYQGERAARALRT